MFTIYIYTYIYIYIYIYTKWFVFKTYNMLKVYTIKNPYNGNIKNVY